MAKKDLTHKELSPFYKLKMLRSKAKNGLLILTIQNALMRLGIDIDPFVVTQEKLDYCDQPKKNQILAGCTFRELTIPEIQQHYETIGMDSCALSALLTSNHRSFGIFKGNQLAAYMMARFNEYSFKSKNFTLANNEVYMCGAYTYDAFRGQGIAPYLRYKCYEAITAQGISNFLSITQYFNKSSLRYKAKLNAKYKSVFLYIEFFHRFNWLFKLKDYPLAD